MAKNERQELRELFEGDAGVVQTATALPQEEGLSKLSQLAQEAKNWQARADKLEAELSEAKNEVQHRLVTKIPEVMRELKMKSFEMDDGTILKITDVYQAKISDENREAAFKWLTQNKFGSLIKTHLSVNVGRATPQQLKALMAKVREGLKAAKIEAKPEIDESVNAMTLKAFVKEQMTEGNPREMPLDVFGARSFQLAKMTPPKGHDNG